MTNIENYCNVRNGPFLITLVLEGAGKCNNWHNNNNKWGLANNKSYDVGDVGLTMETIINLCPIRYFQTQVGLHCTGTVSAKLS